jgi:hypothetical protein
MYSNFASEYVLAESNYKAETIRRGLRPSRRRLRALYEAETRSLTRGR